MGALIGPTGATGATGPSSGPTGPTGPSGGGSSLGNLTATDQTLTGINSEDITLLPPLGHNILVRGNLVISGTSNLGVVSNIVILGGSNGQVLSTNGNGFISWTTATGGGGGGSNIALLPPQYELGPFAPPQSAWFSTTGSASEPTITVSNVTNQGMLFYASGFTAYNQFAFFGRNVSAWTIPWSVVVRMTSSIYHDQYPIWGLALLDNTGKA